MADNLNEWKEKNAKWLLDEAVEITVLHPVHPGTILKEEVLSARGIKGTELAEAIRASRPDVTNMLNGKKPVTPLMAARIERALGFSAQLLCRLQVAYDLAQVQEENEEALQSIQMVAHA